MLHLHLLEYAAGPTSGINAAQLKFSPHPKPQLCTWVPLNRYCIVHAYSAKINNYGKQQVGVITLREFSRKITPTSDTSINGKTFRPFVSSPPGRFATWTVRPQDVSPPGRFATTQWMIRPLDWRITDFVVLANIYTIAWK